MAGILGEFISTLVKSVATALTPKKRRTATRKAATTAKTVHKPKPAVAKPPARSNSKTARVARRTTRRAK